MAPNDPLVFPNPRPFRFPWESPDSTPSYVGGVLPNVPVAPLKKQQSGPMSFLSDLMEVVDTPRAVVASTLNELTDLVRHNGDASFGDWLNQMTFDNHIYGQDLLFGREGEKNSGWGFKIGRAHV